jgi:hypothetical protein
MNVYEIITERIMQKLGQGVVPWHKPWEQGIPRNLVTNKPYRACASAESQDANRPVPLRVHKLQEGGAGCRDGRCVPVWRLWH